MDRRLTIASSLIVGSALSYTLYKIATAQHATAQVIPSQAEKKASHPPLTPEQIKIIKATVPVLQEHGTTITTVFYKNMLTAHPELNSVFNTANQVNGHQSRALAGALYAYAANIDNLAALAPALELMCNKHASLYIKPDDYKIVGKYLLEAMGEVLGDALTSEVHDAWAAAYWALADIMINREANLYKQSSGWTDWRDFKVAKKVEESDEITSFYLKPVDGRPLPPFRAGQYISVRVHVPDLKYTQARQYSLSDKPRSDYYRITVKRESGLNPLAPGAKAHPGYVSNILHDMTNVGDVIQVSHPCGDFFLANDEASHPIVLLSAGVGITPLTSILNTITAKSASSPKSGAHKRKIHFIHGSRTTSSRAFKEHVDALSKNFPNLQVTYFTSNPSDEDEEGVDYHHVGRINLQKLDLKEDLYLNDPRTEFYICGPERFMEDMEVALTAQNVSSDRIKMELFGTGGIPH